MHYTIALILGTVLSTIFFGVNFPNLGNNLPVSDKIVYEFDSTDVPDKAVKKAGIDKGVIETKHDLSCLSGEGLGGLIDLFGGFEEEIIGAVDVDVSIEEEIKVGEQAKKDILSKSSLLTDSRYTNRIDRIMNKLLANLDNPRFKYKWYVVDEDIINAMTCGGFIFIYKGIIDFAEDDDELAAILAHEIYHNELEHIKQHIKKEKIAKGIFGEFSQIPILAATVLTLSYNQKNEANCDLYGIDLCEKAGYDGCHAEKLWQRMNKREGDRMEFEKLFSTHPFSKERANCINKHMKNNYKRTCRH
jgi:predicted Zn-dependent protease